MSNVVSPKEAIALTRVANVHPLLVMHGYDDEIVSYAGAAPWAAAARIVSTSSTSTKKNPHGHFYHPCTCRSRWRDCRRPDDRGC